MDRLQLTRRYYAMRELKDAGQSSNEIGREFGITGARVRFILDNTPAMRAYLSDKTIRGGSYREGYRVMVINLLGAKCCRCGYDQDIRALQIDHINGDGHIERKRKGTDTYRLMIDSIQRGEVGKYQILCANCNMIKRAERKEYRH